MTLDHLAHAERQGDRDDGGQALRDRRHRQADGDEEHVQRRNAAQPAHQEDGGAHDQGGRPQDLAELIELALERRRLLGEGLNHRGDQADLGQHTGADDDAAAAAVGDQRPHEGGVALIADGNVFRQHGAGVLLGGVRFAGEGGFLDAQVDGFHQAQIGRDVIAGLEQDDIAGHQLARRNPGAVAVAHDLRLRSRQAPQGRQGFLGAPLLDDPQDGIEDDDRQDRPALQIVPQRHRHDGRPDQKQHDEVVELRQKQAQETRARRFPQLVGPVLGQPAVDLGLRQAGLG